MHTDSISLFYLDSNCGHVLYVFKWMNNNETSARVLRYDSMLKLEVIARDTRWLAVVVR